MTTSAFTGTDRGLLRSVLGPRSPVPKCNTANITCTNAIGGVFGVGSNATFRAAVMLTGNGPLVWGSVPNVATNGIYTGAGSSNGVVTANPGSMYLNQSGGSATTLYVKESGAGTNTGRVAK